MPAPLAMSLAAVMTQTLLPKIGGGVAPGAELLMVGYGARQQWEQLRDRRDDRLGPPFSIDEYVSRSHVWVRRRSDGVGPERLARHGEHRLDVGILPVHLYGRPANIDAFKKLADDHKLWIIEDCAQSLAVKAEMESVFLRKLGAIFTSRSL